MNLLESWKDRLDERICQLEGTKGVSLRLRFDDKLGEGRFAFLFFFSTETTKGKYLHAYPNRVVTSFVFFQSIPSFRDIPNRSSSSEGKFIRVQVLVQDPNINQR